MKKYEKTPNLYQRFKVQPHIGRYNTELHMCPTFSLVKPEAWTYYEKIDGMNMRIILVRDADDKVKFDIRGRSDRAQISQDLTDNITKMLENRWDKVETLVGPSIGRGITLYGEGYGPGIQKGGGDYREDKGFVLFDIAAWELTTDADDWLLWPQTSPQFYLPHADVADIAENCSLTMAPQVFEGLGIGQVSKRVREGFKSTLAEMKGGLRQAEGIVAKAEGLYHWWDGRMRRMKFKLKTKDFPNAT